MTVVALSGGVGGAKLALGLYRTLPPNTLTVVVNTGDDFDHLGLRICPDLDTVTYALAGLDDPERGWGRREETWTLMRALEALGGDTWFRLGDGDTAMHLLRTAMLRDGRLPTEIAAYVSKRMGIAATLLPATDARVATCVSTDAGNLAFQEYFVRRRCEPRVSAIHFVGAESARITPAVHAAFRDPALEAIIFCPSNPYLSIDPMLALPDLRRTLAARRVPVLAVSPLIGGAAVKGPTAKIMRELAVAATPAAIAEHYAGLIDALIVDTTDTAAATAAGIRAYSTRTLMRTLEDRCDLARFALACARELTIAGIPS